MKMSYRIPTYTIFGDFKHFEIQFWYSRRNSALTSYKSGKKVGGASVLTEKIKPVQYKPSTYYYAKDQQNKNTRWKTPLPFPVQVVAKTEVVDKISRGKLSTVYDYHHGYWDGGEREFRGFGRVDTYDTEFIGEYNQEQDFYTGAFKPAGGLHVHNELEFNPVPESNYSSPTLTKNWFHLGPVGGEFGDWRELTFAEEFWSEDPSVLSRPASTAQMLGTLSRRIKRDAVRTLKGNMLRSETYAFNKLTGPAARPFSVSENQFGIRKDFQKPSAGDAVPGRYGIVFRPPGTVFFPFQVASRSSRWEEGTEPLTTFEFTGDYDDYGQPRRSTSLALPRGILPPYTDSRGSDPNQPILGTLSQTEYAYKDTASVYLCDRVIRSASYEVLQSSHENVFDLGQNLMQNPVPLEGGGSLKPIGCSLNFYDGAAFNGLPYGELGDHGAVTKTETLLITDEQIQNAYGLNRPECFKQNPDYSGYPSEFQNSLQNNDPHLGYRLKENAPYMEGWYRTDVQNRYDFQTAGVSEVRGHVLQSKDAFDNLSEIIYDSYNFLPAEARQYYDSSNYLATQSLYNYRLLKPVQITDENQNRSRFDYSPLGLLRSIALIGQYGKDEGDIVSENPLEYVPSTVFDYNLNEFYHNQKPVWAKTVQREKHWQQDPTHDSPTIKKVEYSDGFGRILQTRAQAEDVIFGATEQERRTGNSGLPADQNAQNQPAIARKKGVTEPDNVVVSGWKVYNNKGKVVEEYEPFFDKGYGYKTSETYTANLAKMTIRYDAGDRPTETEFPDGSKSLIVYGTPDSIVNPPLASSNNKNAFTPSPWERFTYDQNDLGPLTGGNSASTGAFTPKSETVDALGRTIKTTEHDSQPTSNPNVFEDVVMRYEYDIMGNLTKVIDPLGRQAFLYFYDLKPHGEEEDDGSNVLKTIHIDKGTQTTVYDASYKPIESKDAKDAWTLNAYDKLQRPTHLWARDNAQGSMTLRQVFEYGTDIQFNLRGKLVDQYDEAGLQQNTLYDFKGNLLTKKRRTIKKTELLSVFDGPPPNWEVQRYVVDWTGLNTQILSDREFQTRSTYDALNRVIQIRYPRDANNQGKALIPHYNRAGALEKVDFNGKDYVKHIAYNAKGQRILLAMGNNVMTRYTYDTQTFRLKRMRSESFTYSEQGIHINYGTGNNKQDYAYSYDLTGNILKINDESPDAGIGGSTSLERNFEYDPLYRLLKATGRENAPSDPKPWEDYFRSEDKTLTTGYTRKYQYDKLGNILKLQHLGNNNYTRDYNYFSNSNRLEKFEYGSTGSVNYDYDPCGNIISQSTTRKSEWDYADRQITFRDQVAGNEPTKYAQYLYDSEGNRVMKLVRKQGGDWHSITYIDGVFDYLENSDEEEQSISFIMDDTSRIASVRAGDSMGDSSPPEKYNLEDNLGSSITLLDANGSWVNYEEYYPFGETSLGSYAKKRYRYTGKERDEESGMYYYGARYYAPWLCRFISVDPIAAEYPELTPYNYAGNKPISKIDLDGLQPTEPKKPFAQLFLSRGKLGAHLYTSKLSYQYPIKSRQHVRKALSMPKLDPSVPDRINYYQGMSNVAGAFSDEGVIAASPVSGGLMVAADFYFQYQKIKAQTELNSFRNLYLKSSKRVDDVNLSIEIGLWLMESFDIASESGLFESIGLDSFSEDFKLDVVNFALLKIAGYGELTNEQKYAAKPDNLTPDEYKDILNKVINTLFRDISSDKQQNAPKTIKGKLGDVNVFTINIPAGQNKYKVQPSEPKRNYVPKK